MVNFLECGVIWRLNFDNRNFVQNYRARFYFCRMKVVVPVISFKLRFWERNVWSIQCWIAFTLRSFHKAPGFRWKTFSLLMYFYTEWENIPCYILLTTQALRIFRTSTDRANAYGLIKYMSLINLYTIWSVPSSLHYIQIDLYPRSQFSFCILDQEKSVFFVKVLLLYIISLLYQLPLLMNSRRIIYSIAEPVR